MTAALQTEATTTSPWRIFSVAAAAVFMLSLDGMVVPVALPAIDDAHPSVDTAAMAWVIGAATISVAALVVAVGRIGDRIGRRRLFLAGIALVVVGAAASGLAPSFWVLVMARGVLGVGAGLLGGSAIGLTLAVFPETQHTRVITLWTSVGALGGALGPTVGGLLVEGPGWRWIFAIHVAIGVPALVMGARVLVDTEHSDETSFPDMVGAVLSAIILGGLVFGLVQARSAGWTSGRVVAALGVASILIPILLRRASTHPAPIVQPELLRLRMYRRALLVSMLLPMAMFSNFVMIIQYLDEIWGYSGIRSGLAVLPFSITASFTTLLGGRLYRRFDERYLLLVGITMQALSLGFLSLVAQAEPAYLTTVGPALIVLGALAWGIAFPMVNAVSAMQLDSTNYGVGMGLQSMTRQIGALIGVAVVLGQLGDNPDVARFRSLWLLLAGVTTLAVLGSIRLAFFSGDLRSTA